MTHYHVMYRVREPGRTETIIREKVAGQVGVISVNQMMIQLPG